MTNDFRMMRKKAGFRENYAMDRGGSQLIYIRGHLCIKYTYSETDPYQDANGATWDTVTHEWIN